MKKILSIVMTLLIAVTFMPSVGIGNADIAAAKTKNVKVNKPVKVKWQKCTAGYDKITLKWKKAKYAKKYEVQIKRPYKTWSKFKTVKKSKANKKRYTKQGKYKVKVVGKRYQVYKYSSAYTKTITSKKTLTIKKLKPGKQYKVRVRGINRKVAGKFSVVKNIKTKVNGKNKSDESSTDKSKEEQNNSDSNANKQDNNSNVDKQDNSGEQNNKSEADKKDNADNQNNNNDTGDNSDAGKDPEKSPEKPFVQSGDDAGYKIQGWTEPGAKVTAEYKKWNKTFRREVLAEETGKYEIDFNNYVPYTITVFATGNSGKLLSKEQVVPDTHISDDQSKPFITEDSAANKTISGWASPGGTVEIRYTWRIPKNEKYYTSEYIREIIKCDENTGYYSYETKKDGGTVEGAVVVAKTSDGKYYFSENVDYLADAYDSSKSKYPDFLFAGSDEIYGIVEPGSEIIVTSGTETYNTYSRSDGTYELNFFMDKNKEIHLLIKNGNKVIYDGNRKIWEEKEIEKYYADLVVEECGINSVMTDLEKAKLVAEWLCRHMEYSYPYKYNPGITGLITKTGVCMTYAEAYELLLSSDEINVKSRRVYGPDHVWNQLFIEGKWYNVDVTWMDKGSGYNYDWFMISNERAKEIGGEAHSRITDHFDGNVMEANSKRFEPFAENGWWRTDEWRNHL